MGFKLVDYNPIRQAFSKAAIQYELLTGLHKEIGRDLITQIKDVQPVSRILDIGMGTGWLTNRLTLYFPEAKVVGVDFASGMIELAQKHNDDFQIIQADACALPFQENVFDVMISNLTYQWVLDLPKAFGHCWRCLKPKGIFCFTMFGYQSLRELFVSLEHSCENKNHDKASRLRRLPSQVQVREALQQVGFKNSYLDHEVLKVHFPDMMSLMRWIKEIGANRLNKDFYIGKDWLKKANDYYNKNFKDKFGICATFEVLWIKTHK